MISVPEFILRQLPDSPGLVELPGMIPRPIDTPMSHTEAKQIVLGSQTLLYRNSKMPGLSFGLDAFRCIRGSKLADRPGSICSHCYARKNWYRTWIPVRISRERRHRNLRHPRWVDAMVTIILREVSEPYFRWHDSGDLMGAWHLENLFKVAWRTPRIWHWLPTHEPYLVRQVLNRGETIPPNMIIRVSADYVDTAPRRIPGLERVQTSTVHSKPGCPVPVSDSRKHSIECRSYTRRKARSSGAGSCGSCRACWDRRVRNVSYLLHG